MSLKARYSLVLILSVIVFAAACATPKGGKVMSKIIDDNTYTIYVQDDTGAIRSYDVTQAEYNTLDYGDYYGGER